MRRVVATTAAVAVAAATVALGAAQAAADRTAARTVTLHLVEKDVGFNYVDNPPKGGPNEVPLMGDQFVFTADLLTRSGSRAGELDATCTVARGGVNGQSVCTGILALKGGQLTVIARAPVKDSAAPLQIAVVGGTGAYERATGVISSASRGPDSNLSDDTLHLTLP